jgi:hypothetical protein
MDLSRGELQWPEKQNPSADVRNNVAELNPLAIARGSQSAARRCRDPESAFAPVLRQRSPFGK